MSQQIRSDQIKPHRALNWQKTTKSLFCH